MDLNAAQHDAVKTLSGPLLVLAGAGTGKTRVVTYRIAELIRHRVAPARILAVTFTKKAAGEMQERCSSLLGKRLPEKPEISTFHSLCVRILRRNCTRLGYPENFAIYDRGDQESLARSALREIKVPGEVLRPGDLLAAISRWKSSSVRPAEAANLAQSDKEHVAAMAYRRYQQALKTLGAVDFDDLLLCTEELFERFPAVRNAEASRFQHLLIDEYQDTNGSQYRIVKGLAAGHRNLCVVGDDDQSIYGWRGAEVSHILQFQRDWPGAKVVRLEENYRSAAPILELANRLIAFNRQRHPKTLRASRGAGAEPRMLAYEDEIAEAREVVGEIRALVAARKADARDFAILFRTNEQPRPFEAELRRARLPYVLIGGMSFYDRKEVRDVLAYIKLLVNQRDEVSLLRVINNPPRGIGQASVAALLAEAVARSKPLWDVLSQAKGCAGVTAAAAAAVGRFRELVGRYRDRLACESPVDVVAGLIHDIRYQDELARLYPDPNEQTARWNSVEEVVNALGAYQKRAKKPSLSEFLEETTLGGTEDSDEKEAQLSRDAVVLMTLHSAKGLEFSQVYLVGLEEGILPHHRSVGGETESIEEERRLCYVGITRAQDRLTMTRTKSRMKWGKPRPSLPSRFLFEIMGQADNPQYARSLAGEAVAENRRPRPATGRARR